MSGLNRPSIYAGHSSLAERHHKSAASTSKHSDSNSKSRRAPKREITQISSTIILMQRSTYETVQRPETQHLKSHRSLKSRDVKSRDAKSSEHRHSSRHQRISITFTPTHSAVTLLLTKNNEEEDYVDIMGDEEQLPALDSPLKTPDIHTIKPDIQLSPLPLPNEPADKVCDLVPARDSPLKTPDIQIIKPDIQLSPSPLPSDPADKVPIKARRLIKGLSILFDPLQILSIPPKQTPKMRDKIQRGFSSDHLGSLEVQETAYQEGNITIRIPTHLDVRLYAYLMGKKILSKPQAVHSYWKTSSLINAVCTITHLSDSNDCYTFRKIHFSEKVREAIRSSLENKTPTERFSFLADFFKQIHVLIDPNKTSEAKSIKVNSISLEKAVDTVTAQIKPPSLTD